MLFWFIDVFCHSNGKNTKKIHIYSIKIHAARQHGLVSQQQHLVFEVRDVPSRKKS